MSTVLAVKAASFASLAIVSLAVSRQSALAEDFTAKYVIGNMKAEERLPYIAGVVEGLAYARYARDNKGVPADQKTTTGMKCIYDWFYTDNRTKMDLIYAAFGRYGDYPPGAVIAALEKKDCGD